jgi:hypothetical protein
MTVKEIVREYLIKNGFEGLVNQDSECGCDMEDLIVCDERCNNCEPAYRHKCPEGHEADYLMTLSKEPPDELEQGEPNG